jgi:O-antigen/teichoic acid export membrane protein
MRHFRLQFLINAVTFIAAIGLALALIPPHGLRGGLAALAAVTVLRLCIYIAAIRILARRRDA